MSAHAGGRRHALVFGASSGIGKAIVAELSERGWSVSALARRTGVAHAARSLACDVTDDASVADAVAAATAAGGEPSLVVYSAGAGVAGRTTAVPAEVAREAFEVNFWGMERVVRHVYPPMARRRAGSIVLVSSIAALRAVPYEAHYAASKAASARFIECLALEAEEHGVHVAWVAPGYVPTGFLERSGWYGIDRPVVSGSGVTPGDVAREVVASVEGRRHRTLLGWRENAIALADRVLPGAYDRLLRARMRRG